MPTVMGSQRRYIPNCCKLWFPMEETGGSTLLDIVNGVVFTPSSMALGEDSGSVRLVASTGVGPNPAVGLPLTSGSFPAIGTKNFILFAVQKYPVPPAGASALSRANAYIMLNDTAGAYLGIFDGDGVAITSGASGTYVSGTETFAGADGTPNYSANALVRDGSSVGDWVHPTTANQTTQGNTVGTGDIYGRVCRNVGFNPNTPGTYGQWSRNDYAVPDATITNWQNPNVNPSILSYGSMTFGNGGIPGLWSYIDPTYSIGTINRIQIGNGLAGLNDYFGIALVVFDAGLPADFKDALRWMKDQWIAGNKVIWPAWSAL